ncbi:MAG: STAS domain-containing protein [Gammaproteobacteria bacterium]|nr:STAS domain-containing protein [Gammaproteobacteria bacterium]MDH5799341.1 STAS domain-containing protein [Gammaproteobacteria bacterium]
MQYKVNTLGSYSILYLSGDVDLQYSPKARQDLLALLKNTKRVLVDLSAVDYIDSSGVASLVEAYQVANQHQGAFALVGVSDAALQVLQLARLDKVFDIYDTADQAAAAKG